MRGLPPTRHRQHGRRRRRAALCLWAAGAIPNVLAVLAGGAAHGFVPNGARGAQDADAAASAARVLDDTHVAGRGGGGMRREERD